MSLKYIIDLVRTRRWIILGISLIFVIVIFILFLDYKPTSSLQWVNLSELEDSLKEACEGSKQIYPQTSLEKPFPSYAPDGKYYIEIATVRFKGMEVLKIFETDSRKEIGRYYSEYSSFFIHCWDKDSSGIYISDYDPGGTGYGGIFTPSGRLGSVKKLLVPE